MRRGLLVGLGVAALALVVLAPNALAGDWPQPRGDAAATAFQPEEGPEWPDVALRVQLEGDMQAEADMPPLILDDEVLFLARPYDDPDDEAYRVFSVNVDTGEVAEVAEGIDRASRHRMATDGETLYVSGRGAVHAFPLGPEGAEWTWEGGTGPQAQGGEGGELNRCGRMSLAAGNLTVLCHAQRADQSWCAPLEDTSCGSQMGNALAARLDASTGQEHWNWTVPRDPRDREPTRLGSGGSFPSGLAVSGERSVVVTVEGGCSCQRGAAYEYDAGEFRVKAWGLDGDGELEWEQALHSTNWTRGTVAGEDANAENEEYPAQGNPAIDDGAVYVKAGEVHKLNLGTGEPVWTQPVGKEDVDQEEGRSTAISLGEDAAYTASSQTLYRMGQDEPEDGWSTSLDFTAQEGFDEQPIVTPSTVYTIVQSPDAPESVLAFDTDGGDERWQHTGGENIHSFSLGQGLLAYPEVEFHDEGANTSLVILGRTDASLEPVAEVPSRYPDVGEPVEVNLSSSGEGLQGPPTRFKAIWGDGNETDWQDQPVLRHSYAAPGDTEARFLVANDANQTASTTETFHVGQEKPTEPNWLEERFQKENQEMTFGVLGIAMAMGGGLVGIGRRYRKRARLEEELEALEEGFEDTKDQPTECEAFLDNRKARARSLAVDGYLREDQVPVIENRAEELRASLRTGALEEAFGFLPHSLVVKARRMVEDGRVSELERDAFLRAVEEDEMLTSQQKANVRERIEAWFARDAGG